MTKPVMPINHLLHDQAADLRKAESCRVIKWPKPTAQVSPYVDALGPELAVDFLLEFGGATLDFPKRPTSNSSLVKFLGTAKAVALCSQMGNARKRVPTSKPWLAHALKSKGLSGAAIARRLHTTDVTISKWLSQDQADWTPNPASLPLFPDL